MPTEWKLETGTTAYTSWVRSPSQSFSTPLGRPPVLVAELQEVRAYDDGRVEARELPEVVVKEDDLRTVRERELAGIIRDAMTELIGTRFISDQAQREADNEAPTEP